MHPLSFILFIFIELYILHPFSFKDTKDFFLCSPPPHLNLNYLPKVSNSNILTLSLWKLGLQDLNLRRDGHSFHNQKIFNVSFPDLA